MPELTPGARFQLLVELRMLREALDKAREDYMQAVLRTRECGLSDAAIGRATGQTSAASRMLAKRARRAH